MVDSDVETGPPARGAVRTQRLVGWLALVLAVLAVAGVLVSWLRLQLPDDARPVVRFALDQLTRLLYVDAEANAWAWASSTVLALLAAALAVSAAAHRGAGLRWRSLVVLGAVALLLSADEAAMLHETLNEVGVRVTDVLGPFNAWLLPGVVVVLAAGVALLRVARGLDPWLRRRLVVAGAVFLAGAIGMEAVGAAFALTDDAANPWESGTYHVLVGVEEGLEAAGALIALRAVLATFEVRVARGGVHVTPRGRVLREHADDGEAVRSSEEDLAGGRHDR